MAHRTLDHTDMNLFKNRLWKLMEEKNIDTAKKLAKRLYDNGYVSVNQKESFDEPNTIYGRAIGSVEKKILNHLNSNTPEKLQGEYAIAYCRFFGCSADYIFGNISCKTHDVQFIQNETGLSETAISKLQETKIYNDAILDNPALPFISILLEQLDPIHYNDILHEIAAYLRSDGLNEDMWYNIESKALYHKEYGRGKDFNFPIHAHSEMFDNLLLMDIQERLKNLKRQIKKEADTKTN